jgi:hypothetical protein
MMAYAHSRLHHPSGVTRATIALGHLEGRNRVVTD